MSKRFRDHLLSVCSALGGYEPTETGGRVYVIGDEIEDCLLDLRKFCKKVQVVHCLGEWSILSKDLLPILDICVQIDDKPLMNLIIDILLLMTTKHEYDEPGDEIDQIKLLKSFKEAFVNWADEGRNAFSLMTRILFEPLSRSTLASNDDDGQLMRNVLILLGQLAAIPDSADNSEEPVSLQDSFIGMMFQENLIEIILTLMTMVTSSDLHGLSFPLLELFFHIFYGRKPSEIFATMNGGKDALQIALEREKVRNKANAAKPQSRHSRFHGTFAIMNENGIRTCTSLEKILNGGSSEKTQLVSKQMKKTVFDGFYDKVIPLTTQSAVVMNDIARLFLENCFNGMTLLFRRKIEQGKIGKKTELHLLYISHFMLEYNLIRRRNQSETDRLINELDDPSMSESIKGFAFVASNLELDHFNFIIRTMEDKASTESWNEVQACIRCYKFMLASVDAMSGDVSDFVMGLENNIIYQIKTFDCIRALITNFKPSIHSKGYLIDLIETNHAYMRLIENYVKQRGQETFLVLRTKKLRRKLKSQSKDKSKETKGNEKEKEKEKASAATDKSVPDEETSYATMKKDSADGAQQKESKDGDLDHEEEEGDATKISEQLKAIGDEQEVPSRRSSAGQTRPSFQLEMLKDDHGDDDDENVDSRPVSKNSETLSATSLSSKEKEDDDDTLLDANEILAKMKSDAAKAEQTKTSAAANEVIDLDEETSDKTKKDGGNGKKDAAERREEEEEEVEDEEEDEADEEEQVRTHEDQIDIHTYEKDLADDHVVSLCMSILVNYRENSAFTNHCVIKLLHRIFFTFNCKPHFYKLSVLAIFNMILSDFEKNKPTEKGMKEIRDFATYVVRNFFDHLAQYPFLAAEVFFVKHRRDLDFVNGTDEERKQTFYIQSIVKKKPGEGKGSGDDLDRDGRDDDGDIDGGRPEAEEGDLDASAVRAAAGLSRKEKKSKGRSRRLRQRGGGNDDEDEDDDNSNAEDDDGKDDKDADQVDGENEDAGGGKSSSKLKRLTKRKTGKAADEDNAGSSKSRRKRRSRREELDENLDDLIDMNKDKKYRRRKNRRRIWERTSSRARTSRENSDVNDDDDDDNDDDNEKRGSAGGDEEDDHLSGQGSSSNMDSDDSGSDGVGSDGEPRAAKRKRRLSKSSSQQRRRRRSDPGRSRSSKGSSSGRSSSSQTGGTKRSRGKQSGNKGGDDGDDRAIQPLSKEFVSDTEDEDETPAESQPQSTQATSQSHVSQTQSQSQTAASVLASAQSRKADAAKLSSAKKQDRGSNNDDDDDDDDDDDQMEDDGRDDDGDSDGDGIENNNKGSSSSSSNNNNKRKTSQRSSFGRRNERDVVSESDAESDDGVLITKSSTVSTKKRSAGTERNSTSMELDDGVALLETEKEKNKDSIELETAKDHDMDDGDKEDEDEEAAKKKKVVTYSRRGRAANSDYITNATRQAAAPAATPATGSEISSNIKKRFPADGPSDSGASEASEDLDAVTSPPKRRKLPPADDDDRAADDGAESTLAPDSDDEDANDDNTRSSSGDVNSSAAATEAEQMTEDMQMDVDAPVSSLQSKRRRVQRKMAIDSEDEEGDGPLQNELEE